jgi:GntR family transcriptional regulator/MocR family aminotransferase
MPREGQFARDLLLPLRPGDGSLHQQVERAVRDAIRSGRLVAGTALPSTRALARELEVSRGTCAPARRRPRGRAG